jgi:ABC-type transport system involved in multi-copper enzyme maturation permease subunit
MTALFRSELTRFRSRRLIRNLVLLYVGVMVVAGVITFVQTGRDAANFESGQAASFREREVRACARAFGPDSGLSQEERVQECESMIGSADPRFRYADMQEIFLGMTVPLSIMMLLIGASFVGAEWSHGTMTTTLTWEPRRIRVLLVKSSVAALLCFGLYMTLQVLLALILLPAASINGTMEGVDGDWLVESAGVLLRGGGVVCLAAIGGSAMASVGRNTAVALGIGFFYLAVVESILRGVKPHWAPWFLGDNAARFLTAEPLGLPDRSTLEAGLALTAYSLGMFAVALALFRRRDVT